MAELAMSLPLLMMCLPAVISFGIVNQESQILVHAAKRAALDVAKESKVAPGTECSALETVAETSAINYLLATNTTSVKLPEANITRTVIPTRLPGDPLLPPEIIDIEVFTLSIQIARDPNETFLKSYYERFNMSQAGTTISTTLDGSCVMS